MSEIKEATIRTVKPLLFSIVIGIVVAMMFTFIPVDILMVGGVSAILVYLVINLYRMNLDIVRNERSLKSKQAE